MTEKLTNLEIILRKQFESGVAGNSVSQRDFVRQAEEAIVARRTQIDADCARWSHIKANNQSALERAHVAGLSTAPILPHPDNIVIDCEHGVGLLGPCHESEVKRFDQSVRLRDALLMQQAMEDAVDRVPARDRPSFGGAGTLAVVVNDRLPPSRRLSDHLL